MSEIVPNLYLCSLNDMDECPIDAYVVNCTKDIPMCTELGHRLPVNDGRNWESDKDMCSELPTAVEAIHAALEDHCQVYVHCDNITGNYRSATVVVAYMIKYHDMLLDEAIDHVQTCRREAFFFGEHHFMNALIEYSIS
jgi:protein-tyrosine phosphatase